jgi:hypothetical protein
VRRGASFEKGAKNLKSRKRKTNRLEHKRRTGHRNTEQTGHRNTEQDVGLKMIRKNTNVDLIPHQKDFSWRSKFGTSKYSSTSTHAAYAP